MPIMVSLKIVLQNIMEITNLFISGFIGMLWWVAITAERVNIILGIPKLPRINVV
jgi:hypothetical protein